MTDQDRSDYFHWKPDDVEWEKPPQDPPPFPEIPDGGPAGLPDRFLRPSGADRFWSLSSAEQDAALGPEAAAAVRAGSVKLSDLVTVNPMKTEDDFITQVGKVGGDAA